MSHMEETELYDHSVKVNQDLYSNYFNISMSLASELNYLDEKDEEMEQVIAK